MFVLSKQRTKALVALHGWSAIGLGLLLYVVVLTGTVAVFSEEIAYWSVGAPQNSSASFALDIDKQLADLSTKVDQKYWDEISISETAKGYAAFFFHTHAKNPAGKMDELGIEFIIDPATAKLVSSREGFLSDLSAKERDSALSRFLVSVHTELHLPRPWGLLLTGMLGLSMLVAAISGLLMHRHLLADAFVVRRSNSKILKVRDLHTVAGTWSLPFAFVLAFTGSFFSFAGAFGIPAMAVVAFEGDQEALIHTLVGIPETQSLESVPTSSINGIIQNAKNRSGYLPKTLSVLHYHRGDAKIILQLPAAEGKLEPITYEYAGVTGEFLKQKPALGTQDSLGSTAFAIISPLHFGSFSGLLSKFVWVALGIASCYTIASGLALWLRRREETSRWSTFERLKHIAILGLPIAMLASGIGYFLTIGEGDPSYWVPRCFLAAIAGVFLVGFAIRNLQQLKLVLLCLCGLLCILQPVMRAFAGGLGWGNAMASSQFMVIMIDIILVCFGLLACRSAFSGRREYMQLLQSKGAVV